MDIVPRDTVARIGARRRLAVPHHRVWAALADLGSHPGWMKDARSVVFVGDRRSGVGTRMRVRTVIGPIRLVDEMEVTGWEEGRSIEVAHTGLVTGRGRLSAIPDRDGTLVEWSESLSFPWWLGGALTAWLATGILTAVWRGNLRRLEERLSSP